MVSESQQYDVLSQQGKSELSGIQTSKTNRAKAMSEYEKARKYPNHHTPCKSCNEPVVRMHMDSHIRTCKAYYLSPTKESKKQAKNPKHKVPAKDSSKGKK